MTQDNATICSKQVIVIFGINAIIGIIFLRYSSTLHYCKTAAQLQQPPSQNRSNQPTSDKRRESTCRASGSR
jgi:hypothetical protein